MAHAKIVSIEPLLEALKNEMMVPIKAIQAIKHKLDSWPLQLCGILWLLPSFQLLARWTRCSTD